MDQKDVSTDAQHLAHLKRVKQMAEQALKRKGEKPAYHTPVQQMVATFKLQLAFKRTRSGGDHDLLHTSQVPAPYPPSVVPLTELSPIAIKDMRLETHHRGRSIALRVLTPPDRLTAVMAIVEDEQGTGTLLQLYHQPDESLAPCQEIIREKRVCIVKEPFFKATVSGPLSIRVDHVNDIVWLADSDMRVPQQWRVPMRLLDGSSHNARMLGNSAVQNEEWCKAERLYSNAVMAANTPEEEGLAHLNRALANLKLACLQDSLNDAIKAGGSKGPDQPPSEKAMFRQARASYELGQFKVAINLLEKLTAEYPGNSSAVSELTRARARLHEQETGEYSFKKMHRQAQAPEPIIDCATFKGPVEIRKTPNTGRGLFVTRDVKAGDLMFCEKAYAYVYAGEDQPGGRRNTYILMHMESDTISMGGQASLITEIIQKLARGHPGSSMFRELHCGDYKKVVKASEDGRPVVDSFLASQIVRLNSFGAPRSNREELIKMLEKKSSKMAAFGTSGIWLLASHTNHSCIGNCRRSFIGDMQIVRAARDLKKGTELRFPYVPHHEYTRYEEFQRQLGSWGFRCDCDLCLEAKNTPAHIWRRRDDIHQSLTVAFNKSTPSLKRVKQLLSELDETYHSEGSTVSGLRLETWDPYAALGGMYLEKGRHAEAAENLVKALEAQGYDIVAIPPRGEVTSPRFEIRTWGRPTEYSVVCLAKLAHAYRKLAPSLVDTIVEYARVAYRINVGEDATFDDVFYTIM